MRRHDLDLNQLLYRHQVALIQAPAPAAAAAHTTCSDLAHHYARKIRQARENLGVAQYRPCLAECG